MIDYHWRGDSQAEGGAWYHYPEGRQDYSGPKHSPVVTTEATVTLKVDGVVVSNGRTFSQHCLECGVRSGGPINGDSEPH